jgi:aldehyde:ferredoxin oxidoreductase
VKAVFGRYLWVDLSAERITEKEIPERFYELHLGGRGLASRLLLEHVPPGTDPFSPQNALIFATGPFQGTGLAGAGRHVVMAISPKTRSIADSYVGGFLGHELGRSGYDGIFITGRASIPVYLLLYEGKAELREARDLWGKFTGDVERELRRRHPGVRVAAIGPAGEKLVSQACIIHDRNRAAGRPGLGAVMGAKLLKAIAVKGHTEKPLAHPEKFAKARAEFAQDLLSDEGYFAALVNMARPADSPGSRKWESSPRRISKRAFSIPPRKSAGKSSKRRSLWTAIPVRVVPFAVNAW